MAAYNAELAHVKLARLFENRVVNRQFSEVVKMPHSIILHSFPDMPANRQAFVPYGLRRPSGGVVQSQCIRKHLGYADYAVNVDLGHLGCGFGQKSQGSGRTSRPDKFLLTSSLKASNRSSILGSRVIQHQTPLITFFELSR